MVTARAVVASVRLKPMEWKYVDYKDGICITEAKTEEAIVVVPEKLDGKQVVAIGAKAFLSQMTVKVLELPETVREVSDWAFCHMKQLEVLRMGNVPSFGRQVFKGCTSLAEIRVAGFQAPRLLSKLLGVWPDVLACLKDAMENEKLADFWMTLDQKLEDYLESPDDKDFVPGFVGWFDDSDVDVDRKNWIEKTKREKCELVFERLVAKDAKSTYCGDYLLEEKHLESTLSALCGEKLCDHVENFRVFEALGGFEKVAPSKVLERIEHPEPEVSSFLLNLGTPGDSVDNFFSNLGL